MSRRVVGMIIAIGMLAGAASGWGQQYLYVPKAVGADEKVQKSDGVLVREVPVKKGDTLSAISRTFSGHASYYPQILLFNDIKNPNRIYTGDLLRVPVSRSDATLRPVKKTLKKRHAKVSTDGAAQDSSVGDQKKGAAVEDSMREVTPKPVATAGKRTKSAKQPPEAPAATSEQRLFERAIKAYRQDDFRAALELFDRFLADYPSSPLAADATLYKAECYLKQSNQ